MLPRLFNAHLVNGRTLSAEIRMFNGKVVFAFMVSPEGRWVYQHLMVNTVGHQYETIPIYR